MRGRRIINGRGMGQVRVRMQSECSLHEQPCQQDEGLAAKKQ